MSLVPAPLAAVNWRVLSLVMALGLFGLVILFSAAGGNISPWAQSQGIKFIVFSGLAIALSWVSIDFWKDTAFIGYGVVLVMLIAVEIVGGISGGSQRWLDLGFIRLQPSELMKLMIILAMARFFDVLPVGEIRTLNALWPPALMIGLPFILVMLQPDLGTATMIAAGGIIILFLSGIPLRLFAGAGALLAIALPIIYAFLHDYQRKRVLIFLNPESDPLGSGYHITQSKIAIGSGGIFGKGFLNGTQSHLDYLPEGHTDFVFATMAEEWGLIGGVAIIGGFILLTRWGMRVSARAPSRFAKLTAAGLITTIFFYVAINLMMVMGLAPVVGIPLPLISFGGTAMLTVMICLGILMGIERDSKNRRRQFGG
jgi:rod shape determining protein RodA